METTLPRALRLATWLFFSLTLYDLFAVTSRPLLHLPDLGDHNFVVVCVLFTILHCTLLEGLRRTAIFFTISAIVSYCLEEIGVRTGLIYGSYHYSAMLGAKLGHVPIIIPLAWFMMIYPSWLVARTILTGTILHALPGRIAQALLAAWVVTSWDTVMDPGMAASGNWIWEHGGDYFGVPRHNYLGWLLTTFLVYFLASWLWRDPHPPHHRSPPLRRPPHLRLRGHRHPLRPLPGTPSTPGHRPLHHGNPVPHRPPTHPPASPAGQLNLPGQIPDKSRLDPSILVTPCLVNRANSVRNNRNIPCQPPRHLKSFKTKEIDLA